MAKLTTFAAPTDLASLHATLIIRRVDGEVWEVRVSVDVTTGDTYGIPPAVMADPSGRAAAAAALADYPAHPSRRYLEWDDGDWRAEVIPY